MVALQSQPQLNDAPLPGARVLIVEARYYEGIDRQLDTVELAWVLFQLRSPFPPLTERRFAALGSSACCREPATTDVWASPH